MIVYLILGAVVLYFLYMGRKTPPIKKLVQQSAKWATTAQQDESPIIAVLHANYAVGYLWAVKDISRESGVDIKQFEEHILNVQSMVTKKVLKKCPELAGDIDLYLSSIAES
jgi:hypothetical protein